MDKVIELLPYMPDPVIVNASSYDPVLVYCMGGITLLWMVFMFVDVMYRRMA